MECVICGQQHSMFLKNPEGDMTFALNTCYNCLFKTYFLKDPEDIPLLNESEFNHIKESV